MTTNKKLIPVIVAILLLSMILFIMITGFLSRQAWFESKTESNHIVTIGIASNASLMNDTFQHYKIWLEEQTGLTLNFVVLPQSYTAEYLDQMFRSGNIPMDALFSFPSGYGHSYHTILQEYGEKGYILPMERYITQSPVMKKIFEEFTLYNLEKVMTAQNGSIYYMPGLDTSLEEACPQILWINQSWLKALGLKVPETLDEFTEVLKRFQEDDPNGNGIKDEITFAGSSELSEISYDFLINSFVYNDPFNCRMAVDNGVVFFAPSTQEWREAVLYLNELYTEGLLDPFQFSFSNDQLIQLANDPRNLLGAFTSSDITDVLLSSSPEVINNFVRVPPLIRNGRTPSVAVKTPLPSPNGIITSTCKHPDDVFRLFELMMTEEAFLIGRYGRQGVDWQLAKPFDIDIFGNSAVLRVQNQSRSQNENSPIRNLGPYFSYTKYTDAVAWNGIEVDQRYINARAYKLYQNYQPKDYITMLLYEGEEAQNLRLLQKKIADHTDSELVCFIRGEKDPSDDEEWQRYQDGYKRLGIDVLLPAVQTSYDSLKGITTE